MKLGVLVFCCFLFSSSSVLFPVGISFNRADCSYDYYAFNKKLYNSDVSYLLNPINYRSSKFINDSNLATVVNLFEDKLAKM